MVFTVYAGSDDLGSTGKVYNFLKLVSQSKRQCVSGEVGDYAGNTTELQEAAMLEAVKAAGYINVWDGHNCGEAAAQALPAAQRGGCALLTIPTGVPPSTLGES
eukprot:1181791-Prorocentrum_minimum.AAC.4